MTTAGRRSSPAVGGLYPMLDILPPLPSHYSWPSKFKHRAQSRPTSRAMRDRRLTCEALTRSVGSPTAAQFRPVHADNVSNQTNTYAEAEANIVRIARDLARPAYTTPRAPILLLRAKYLTF